VRQDIVHINAEIRPEAWGRWYKDWMMLFNQDKILLKKGLLQSVVMARLDRNIL
jgi:Fe-S cluster biosynthesis and repair protein YggX